MIFNYAQEVFRAAGYEVGNLMFNIVVTGVVNLVPAMDYDIDYLQGRVVLAEPLASTVDDNLLVKRKRQQTRGACRLPCFLRSRSTTHDAAPCALTRCQRP